MRRFSLLLSLTLFVAPLSYGRAKIETTEDLVQAMQKKYAKSWYKTATFVQKTTNYLKFTCSRTAKLIRTDPSFIR